MNLKVSPHIDKRSIIAPACKSYAQRAILAAALSRDKSIIRCYGKSDDVKHIIEVAKQMGAQLDLIDIHPETLQIRGFVNEIGQDWFVGESGLGARLAIPIAAALTDNCEINGTGSLLNRPMHTHAEALTQLGVEVNANNAALPFSIKGKIKGGKLTLDGSASSQYFSGLFMALPLATADSVVRIKNLASRPYLNMTLELLKDFGITVKKEGDQYIIPGNQCYKGVDYSVEADWSGAAFWIVYGALQQSIEIHGLNSESLQADRAVLEVMELCGADYRWHKDILIVGPQDLKPFEYDAWHCPDLFPALVVLAAGIKGQSIIHGVDRLKHKESDRGVVLKQEFAKLGLVIELNGNTMLVYGTGSLHSGSINSNNDHRIAMAGAIAAELTNEGVVVENAEAVTKSYPDFWEEIS